MRKIKKDNNIFKVVIFTFTQLFVVTLNLIKANPKISNIKDATNFVLDKLSINKDEVFIYMFGVRFLMEKKF